jgi:hypothetical protein
MFSRRDFLKLSGAAFLATAFGNIELAQADNISAPIIYHGSRRYPLAALTYDDCQLVTKLHLLEDILNEYPETHVTLFPIGDAFAIVETKDPGIWKRFHSKGHEIGYHSFNHDNLELYKPQQVVDDYDRWLNALTQVLDAQPTVRFARPPFNIISEPFLYMCSERGLVCTQYSIGGGGPAAYVMNAIRKFQNGDIIQFHTRDQPGIRAKNQAESRDMVSTSEAIPFIDSLGVQCVTLSQLYDNLLHDQINTTGCDIDTDNQLTRTCID